jgi:hypothetical protein
LPSASSWAPNRNLPRKAALIDCFDLIDELFLFSAQALAYLGTASLTTVPIQCVDLGLRVVNEKHIQCIVPDRHRLRALRRRRSFKLIRSWI